MFFRYFENNRRNDKVSCFSLLTQLKSKTVRLFQHYAISDIVRVTTRLHAFLTSAVMSCSSPDGEIVRGNLSVGGCVDYTASPELTEKWNIFFHLPWIKLFYYILVLQSSSWYFVQAAVMHLRNSALLDFPFTELNTFSNDCQLVFLSGCKPLITEIRIAGYHTQLLLP